MHYANPQVDHLELEQALALDTTERMKDFHIIHADVLNDLPVMYLNAPLTVACARSDLHNYEPSPEGPGEMWNVWDW